MRRQRQAVDVADTASLSVSDEVSHFQWLAGGFFSLEKVRLCAVEVKRDRQGLRTTGVASVSDAVVLKS